MTDTDKDRNFTSVSYERHRNTYRKKGLKEPKPQNRSLLAYGEKMKLYSFLDPLIEIYPDAKWLVVGDGRFAEGSLYLADKGVSAMPSDIDASLLKNMKQNSMIDDFAEENAENLSFEDNSFDFILCKESFHHFPRPYLALYEMLRVASKGVVLIEPQEWAGRGCVAEFSAKIRNVIRKIRGGMEMDSTYEETGNFVFRLSLKEMEKISKALNFRYLLWRETNGFYNEKTFSSNKNSAKARLYTFFVMLTDIFTKFGAASTTLSAALIKDDISREALHSASKKKIKIKKLPSNPKIKG